jgi:hypothetical protein
MAGMYSAPGCFTCKFGQTTGPIDARQWQCNWHHRLLPPSVYAGEHRVLICQRFVHYSETNTEVTEPTLAMSKLYPDYHVLYSYPNEYSTGTDVVVNFEQLPVIR